MMNKISDTVIKNKSYEDDFQAIYEADHDITVDEAEALMKKSYFFSPAPRAATSSTGTR